MRTENFEIVYGRKTWNLIITTPCNSILERSRHSKYQIHATPRTQGNVSGLLEYIFLTNHCQIKTIGVILKRIASR